MYFSFGKKLFFTSVLFFALLLAACGGDDSGTASQSTPAVTRVPTSTPTVTATPTVTPTPTEIVLASDDFTSGLDKWKIEQQDATGTVTATGGVLDITQPSGATLWFRQKFSGNYEISFTAVPVPFTTGKYVERISDLNVFWNATDPSGSDPISKTFDAALTSYNPLYLYYVGFGANSNTTTRLRRNDGTDARPQITGYADGTSVTAADTAGAMTADTKLDANTETRVRIVSRSATQDDPYTLKWYANDVLIFKYTDASPYTEGWFAFRTTTSHFKLSKFKVIRLNS